VSYRESLAYLYGLQRFGIKLGLENIRRLLERAGDPQHQLRLVHVAGTNGKGSVCSMLAALLMKAGHRTGLYTSPHLHEFNERIRVDDVPIDDGTLVAWTDELKRLCAEDIPATFFEFTTAMALCHFRERGVAWGVLETGMGGRLDATNVVEPQVSVITSLSLDHGEHLGGSLEAVAAEKAGIIKAGIPVVSASQPAAAMTVLQKRAAEMQAPLYVCGDQFRVVTAMDGLTYQGLGLECTALKLSLAGEHQNENLALALAAFELTGAGRALGCDGVREALSGVAWPGRLEWWPGRCRLLLDGAHNLAGCQTLARYLRSNGFTDVQLIFGAKGDKAAEEMLAELLPLTASLHLVAPPVEAAFPFETLERVATADGKPVCINDRLDEALTTACCAAGDDGVVVVAGSLFMVAAAREALRKRR